MVTGSMLYFSSVAAVHHRFRKKSGWRPCTPRRFFSKLATVFSSSCFLRHCIVLSLSHLIAFLVPACPQKHIRPRRRDAEGDRRHHHQDHRQAHPRLREAGESRKKIEIKKQVPFLASFRVPPRVGEQVSLSHPVSQGECARLWS